jgi:hypothetical protein
LIKEQRGFFTLKLAYIAKVGLVMSPVSMAAT